MAFSKEAKSYRDKLVEQGVRIAEALVYNTLASKIMFSLYITFHNPKIPIKLFSSKEKAIEWLSCLLYMTETEEDLPAKRSRALV